jgi:hypothetical protein
MYEYHYWKCYYSHSSPSFKAAALYSTDVDYYTYGECRLVSGSYYCGPMATLMPYKGMTTTRDTTAHLGTDVHAKDAVTTGTAKFDPENYVKLPTVANPDYYGGKLGGDSYTYSLPTGNNGQPLTYRSTTSNHVTAEFSNGDPKPDYSMNSLDRSNYAMAPGAAAQANGGVHVANGLATMSSSSKYSLFPSKGAY